MAVQKVLCRDDNVTDLKNIEQIVSSAGCTVVSATGGKQAVEKAKSEKPDLIFFNIVMRDMDGYATVRALQADQATKAIPVVFVSSKVQQADKVWAQLQGGADLAAKHYTKEQIIEQIKRAA